jgi:hypothetical protein
MSRHHDPDLDYLYDREPALEHYTSLLRAARQKPPQLDPNFRLALRRRLMQAAYDRYQPNRGPSILARIFSGPGMAVGLAAAAVLLLVFVLVVNGGSWFGPGQVQVTTVGAVAVNQPITVSFNQPMNHQSVEKAIQIEPATQVTYTWHGNNLVIQPSSGELAPNTQYHVTVAADAKTAPGVKIGQTAVVAVTTAPLPTPSPTPLPSPSPPAPPQITAERSIPSTSGRVIGWSADGHTLFFISASGDLDLIASDGSVLKTLASGVRLGSVMPGGSAVAYATAGSDSKLFLANPDTGVTVADTRSVDAIGWQSGKPVVQVQGEIGPAGATTKLPAADVQCVFAPDGSRLVCATLPGTNQASQKPVLAFLFDLASQKATNWTAAGQGFAWKPDGTKVAYWSGGSVLVAGPDGSGPLEVGKSPQVSVQAWSPDGQFLLFANQSGATVVKADGSGLHQLSDASFQGPVWAPSGSRFAFARGSSLWIDDITVSGSNLDLGAAGRVVDQYEQARIKNDVAAAGSLLTPSAVPTTPSPVAGDTRLTRYFVISSQATATEVRCTVRLIFAKGSDEVRYQDEQLVIVPAGAGLKIGSIIDSPPHDLGKGPTVNSVQLLNGFVVVVFDSDLDPASVAGSTVLTAADGKPVALTTAYFNRRLTVTAKLNPGDKYHLSLAGSLKDIAGQSLQGGYEYDFVALAPAPTP